MVHTELRKLVAYKSFAVVLEFFATNVYSGMSLFDLVYEIDLR